MVFCPFCDNQGIINRATVKEKGIHIYICDECDTIWLMEDIQENNCKNFKIFMNELGLKGLWSELDNVERL